MAWIPVFEECVIVPRWSFSVGWLPLLVLAELHIETSQRASVEFTAESLSFALNQKKSFRQPAFDQFARNAQHQIHRQVEVLDGIALRVGNPSVSVDQTVTVVICQSVYQRSRIRHVGKNTLAQRNSATNLETGARIRFAAPEWIEVGDDDIRRGDQCQVGLEDAFCGGFMIVERDECFMPMSSEQTSCVLSPIQRIGTKYIGAGEIDFHEGTGLAASGCIRLKCLTRIR